MNFFSLLAAAKVNFIFKLPNLFKGFSDLFFWLLFQPFHCLAANKLSFESGVQRNTFFLNLPNVFKTIFRFS